MGISIQSYTMNYNVYFYSFSKFMTKMKLVWHSNVELLRNHDIVTRF